MNRPTHRLNTIEDLSYYRNVKRSAENLPPGDIRAIKIDTYSKVIAVLEKVLEGKCTAADQRIATYLERMNEKLSQVTT